jgi:putative ABC transport system permease protein
MFGVDAETGRTLSPDIDMPGSERTIVISHGLWQAPFGGDESIIGRTLKFSEESFTVAGVMPATFDYPEGTEVWAAAKYRTPDPPFDFGADPAEVRGAEYFAVLARLKGNVTIEQAQAEMDAIGARLREEYIDTKTDEGFNIVYLRDSIVGEIRPILFTLLGAVCFVLLIACANVANLLLVKASGRDKEIAVRMALGASRPRIVGQLITESILLALCGGLLGILFALWGTNALLALVPEDIPRAAEVSADLGVLGFAMLVSFITGTLFGLAPSLQYSGQNLQESIREGSGRHASGLKSNRLRNLLIIGEVAVSLFLVVGAGLMMRTFFTLNVVDPGFNPENVYSARVWIPSSRYDEDEKITNFYREVIERVRIIPGVQSAGAVLSLPVNSGINGTLSFSIEGRPVDPGYDPVSGYQLVSSDYFKTVGIPILQGRTITDADNENTPMVALVNEALADELWPGENPLGHRVTWGTVEDDETEYATIVGIVGNTRHSGLDEDVRTEIYRPYCQAPMPFMTLVIKSSMAEGSMISAIRNTVAEVDPGQPVIEAMTMEQVLSDSLGQRRFNMHLLSLFAGAALIMAAVGLYGVLSFSVAQRSREIGISMALGASTNHIVGRIVKEGFRLVLIGLIIGTVGAAGLTRLITRLIYGVSATDPITFILGILVMTIVALTASCIPALRASRVDPMIALRIE